jgi:hypothetical protein
MVRETLQRQTLELMLYEAMLRGYNVTQNAQQLGWTFPSMVSAPGGSLRGDLVKLEILEPGQCIQMGSPVRLGFESLCLVTDTPLPEDCPIFRKPPPSNLPVTQWFSNGPYLKSGNIHLPGDFLLREDCFHLSNIL